MGVSPKAPQYFFDNFNCICVYELPFRHIEGTTLLCLKVETQELYEKMQNVAARFLKESS